MKKCNHEKISIYRDLKVLHTSEIEISFNEDDIDAKVVDSWTHDFSIGRCSYISVICRRCDKKWNGDNINSFPKWIQEVLNQEELHFKDL